MKKILISSTFAVLLMANLPIFAQSSPTGGFAPVVVTGYAGNAPAQLQNYLHNSVFNALTDTFNNTVLTTLKNFYYAPNPYLTQIDVAVSQSTTSLDSALSAIISDIAATNTNIIDNALNGYTPPGAPTAAALKPEQVVSVASDDIVKGGSGGLGSTSLFSSNEIVKTADIDNSMFNISSLIAPDNYCVSTQCSDKTSITNIYNATSFIQNVSAGATTPPVLRVTANSDFYLPLANTKDLSIPYTKMESIKTPIARDILIALNKDPNYRLYKEGYRSFLALRSFYLDTLYRAFYARKPITDSNNRVLFDGKSIQQMRDERVNEHLSKNYTLAVQTASPATLARQQVLLLAQISGQLHRLAQQNERILLTDTLNGLATLSTTSQAMATESQNVSKKIVQLYCQAQYPVDNNASTKDRQYQKKQQDDCIQGHNAGDLTSSLTETQITPTASTSS